MHYQLWKDWQENNTIRTIRALTNLVKEHSVDESLEKWYRVHDKESSEYQIIRMLYRRMEIG